MTKKTTLVKPMSHDDVKIINKTIRHQGFFCVAEYQLQHRLFNGEWSKPMVRELFERGNSAAILLYDPIRDQVVLLEQFRVGALLGSKSPWLWEIAAGMVEENEQTEQVVRREAKEETGMDIKNLVLIYQYWASPGASSEHIDLFCGQVDASKAGGIYGISDEHEDIRTSVVDREEAWLALEQGVIDNSAAIIALQWLQLNHNKLKKQWSGL